MIARAPAGGERAPSEAEAGAVSPPPLVAWWGLFAGSSMLALSITGLLWRIDALTVTLSVLAALAASALLARYFERRPVCPRPYLLLLALLLVIPTLAAFAPPHEWDEVAYGATLPRDYAHAGRFFYNADYGPFSAFPGNYEAITTASLILFGHVAPARLFDVALAFGLALIAMHLAVRLGVPEFVAPVAAVLVLGAPSLQGVTLIVKNDVANAFFQALTLLALADYAARRRISTLALAGFFLGTAVGTKYSSLQFALCVVPLTLALILRGARRRSDFFPHAAVFAAIATASALPWYARNFALFGNPFFPFFNEALHARNAFTSEHSALVREMFDGLTGFSWSAGTPRNFMSQVVSGFGLVPVLSSLPGLALAVTSRRSAPSLLLAGVFTSFGLLTLFAGYWAPRYFLSLLVLAGVFAAVGLAEVLGRVRLLHERRREATIAVAVVAVLLGASSLRTQLEAQGGLITSFFGTERREFLESHVAYWTVADWINRNTPPGDKVGMGLGVKPFYYLERPYFNIQFLTEKGNLQALDTADEYLDAFRSLGLQWVAFRPWQPGPRHHPSKTPRAHAFARRLERAIATLHREGKIELATRMGDVSVYRIRTRPAEDDRS
jgi:4-amino-4-deoxy-L-arabinose transferase-like glycosyltransferase